MVDTVVLLGRVRDEVARLAEQPRREALADWVQLAADCQKVLNQVQAVQAVALANVSAIEDVVDRDGEVVEQFRGYDHQRLDAPALVSDVLGLTASAAATRVAQAAEVVARHPVVLEAMAAGRVDFYRAGIVVDELRDAPDDLCLAVADRVGDKLGAEPGGRLRQRVRRVLGQVGEEFLRQKAVRARADRSLRRWAGDQPGVDTWMASLPTETSGKAWSAIDTLARQLVSEGTCSSIEQARADAMLALIQGSSRAEYLVQVAVPASGVAATDGSAADQVLDRETVARLAAAVAGTDAPPRRVRLDVVPCHEGTGAYASTPVASWTMTPGETTARRCHPPVAVVSGYRPTEAMVRTVKARDGRCRFPGCTVAAVFCDLDHVVAWPVGPTTVANLLCLCRRHHRVKQLRRWQVRMLADATVVWTDPTGRLRTTFPVDHLEPESTPWLEPADDPVLVGAEPTGPPPSPLEDHADHLLDHARLHGPRRRRLTRPDGRPIGMLHLAPDRRYRHAAHWELTGSLHARAGEVMHRRSRSRRSESPPPF